MNFLKNSIFSRGAGDSSPDWEPENENQMLAVWGSPGSGKTTTAVKLAARLAMQKKDVALLLRWFPYPLKSPWVSVFLSHRLYFYGLCGDQIRTQ